MRPTVLLKFDIVGNISSRSLHHGLRSVIGRIAKLQAVQQWQPAMSFGDFEEKLLNETATQPATAQEAACSLDSLMRVLIALAATFGLTALLIVIMGTDWSDAVSSGAYFDDMSRS